ncbi:hypothetical protein [Bradyrhizobium lablabi]|uniref:hypothetical protein n=1 Tax=Bradyrhizobium lablabi TaxID=722472 RepID=UPI001BAC0996|nr:hypothetical protein [Bradyrhizobium lablabi]MBR0692726.1 hypothetical protein [Bradyrhizobium lablabi]
MLRDLATMLEDLQGGMQTLAQQSAVRLTQAEMTLPVDVALVLKDGSCALLADAPRNAADAPWWQAQSRLTVSFDAVPTEWLP